MAHPFVRAALTLPVVAAVLIGTAGPAAANDWTIKKPPTDECYYATVNALPGGPATVSACPP